MTKQIPVRRIILILLLIFLAGVFSFPQTVQVPLEQLPAEKVMTAWDILHGNTPLSVWHFHPLELPVYLLSVLVFRLSTYAAVTAAECFYLLLFCSGLWILSGHRMLTPVSCLIWAALAGTPDPALIRNIRQGPMLSIGILFFLHFLTLLLSSGPSGTADKIDPVRRQSSVRKASAGLVISIAVLLFAPDLPSGPHTDPAGLHGTLRAMQKVFRADFSKQPLLQLSTARYFLNTVILLLILFTICRALPTYVNKQRIHPLLLTFSAAFFLTVILSSFLPGFSGKEMLCAWLPFGGGVILSAAYESSTLKKTSFMDRRIPFPAAMVIFFTAAVCFGVSPIVTSRPQSPADKAAAFLHEHELRQGSCGPEDLAVLTTASKGTIRFTADAGDPDNAFRIIRKQTEPEHISGEVFEIDPYLIIIDR